MTTDQILIRITFLLVAILFVRLAPAMVFTPAWKYLADVFFPKPRYRMRQYVIGFDSVTPLVKGETRKVISTPQIPFRPRRITTLDSMNSLMVDTFLVNGIPQFTTPVPSEAFKSSGHGMDLSCDLCPAGKDLAFTISNPYDTETRFVAGVFGEVQDIVKRTFLDRFLRRKTGFTFSLPTRIGPRQDGNPFDSGDDHYASADRWAGSDDDEDDDEDDDNSGDFEKPEGK